MTVVLYYFKKHFAVPARARSASVFNRVWCSVRSGWRATGSRSPKQSAAAAPVSVLTAQCSLLSLCPCSCAKCCRPGASVNRVILLQYYSYYYYLLLSISRTHFAFRQTVLSLDISFSSTP